jgi:hypothetical protein
MTLNEKGARVRCHRCGRLTKTVYPCKVCGGVRHIVAIVRTQIKQEESPAEMFERGRRLAAAKWRKQAGIKRRMPYTALVDQDAEPGGVARDTIIFDIDDEQLTVTMYPRKSEMRYPL